MVYGAAVTVCTYVPSLTPSVSEPERLALLTLYDKLWILILLANVRTYPALKLSRYPPLGFKASSTLLGVSHHRTAPSRNYVAPTYAPPMSAIATLASARR